MRNALFKKIKYYGSNDRNGNKSQILVAFFKILLFCINKYILKRFCASK